MALKNKKKWGVSSYSEHLSSYTFMICKNFYICDTSVKTYFKFFLLNMLLCSERELILFWGIFSIGWTTVGRKFTCFIVDWKKWLSGFLLLWFYNFLMVGKSFPVSLAILYITWFLIHLLPLTNFFQRQTVLWEQSFQLFCSNYHAVSSDCMKFYWSVLVHLLWVFCQTVLSSRKTTAHSPLVCMLLFLTSQALPTVQCVGSAVDMLFAISVLLVLCMWREY